MWNYISVQSESMDPPVGLRVFRTNPSLAQEAPCRKRSLLDGVLTVERKAMFHSQRPDILSAILNQRTFLKPPEPIYELANHLVKFPRFLYAFVYLHPAVVTSYSLDV